MSLLALKLFVAPMVCTPDNIENMDSGRTVYFCSLVNMLEKFEFFSFVYLNSLQFYDFQNNFNSQQQQNEALYVQSIENCVIEKKLYFLYVQYIYTRGCNLMLSLSAFGGSFKNAKKHVYPKHKMNLCVCVRIQ